MDFKKFIDANFKRWFLNSDGNISFTKVGLQVAAIGAAVATFPATMAAAGVVVALPAAVIVASKYAVILGTLMAGTGAKDTVDKANKK